jgi:DNA-directed RNA polymerase subunit RPC12/RpoP
MNNIFLNGVKNKMSIVRKICMDCGKQFISESEESAVICEDCVALLKRRFWSSIKIGKAYDNM